MTGARLVLHSCSDEGQSATASMANRMGSVNMSRLLRCIPSTSVACSTGSSATGQSNRDVMSVVRFWLANVVLYSLYSFVPKPAFSFNGCRQLGPQRVTSALTRTEWGRACVQATRHRQRKAAPSRCISVQRCQSCRCRSSQSRRRVGTLYNLTMLCMYLFLQLSLTISSLAGAFHAP